MKPGVDRKSPADGVYRGDDGARAPRRSSAQPRLVLLMAIACGCAAANLYYAQPLLHTLGHAFGVSEGTAGLLVTVTQLGYVGGLAVSAGSETRLKGRILATQGRYLSRRRGCPATV